MKKKILTRIRKSIIPKALGDVLEIGYGTGVNFKYYKLAQIKNLSVIDKKSFFASKKENVSISFFEGRAENLPFADASFDTVVETLVLCSVDNLDKAVNEIHRVLKPGGIFIFIDHVLPDNKNLASLFKAVNIIWPKITGGCNLTREPHKIIEATGFFLEQSSSSSLKIFRWGVGKK